MKITPEMLRQHGACEDQVELFESLWPNGVVPTVALAEKHAGDFDWGWAAENLLSSTAQGEYKRVTATALAEYNRVTASAWDEYERVKATALAEYKRATAPAWDEYVRVIAPALAEYERAVAAAFVEAWRNQHDSLPTR